VQRRIFLTFAGLILASVLLLAMAFVLLSYHAMRNNEQTAIRDKTHLIASMFNQYPTLDHRTINSGGSRFTLIAPDGLARFDNHRDADLTINRSNREEFVQALQFGTGQAIRPSETLGADTFYYAVRLNNGDVLRLSRTLHSLGAGFRVTLPALVVVFLIILAIAYGVAHRLTRAIIKPITHIDLEQIHSHDESPLPPYEELWPFIQKITHQRIQLTHQLTTLYHRAETIDTLIANMREGLIILDGKGQILAANKSAAHLFGMKKKCDLINWHIQHIHRDPTFASHVKKCLEGTFTEIDFTRKDKHYNAFFSPVAQNDNNGAILFFLDTTQHYKAQQQRREFTANVSHELKTPLTTIAATAEMITNGMAQPQDVPAFARKITEQTTRLMHIINDIIRLSEFDESKVERDFAPFDLYALAQSTIAALQPQATEKSIAITLSGASLFINANARLIEELLSNLIENGIKYNKDGGEVAVGITEENGCCIIAVTDTGIGIAKGHRRRVFERFYRVDASRSKKTGGTGLGLAIVKHIAEHHGGSVKIDSTVDVGTVVVCRLPGCVRREKD